MGNGVAGFIVIIIQLAIIAFLIVSFWKVFTKAGQPGWACLIPIYNLYVLLVIAKKPVWWIIMFFIPLVNIIFLILASIAVAENFGKGAGFGIGLAFLGIIYISSVCPFLYLWRVGDRPYFRMYLFRMALFTFLFFVLDKCHRTLASS